MAKHDHMTGCGCGLYRECQPGCEWREGTPIDRAKVWNTAFEKAEKPLTLATLDRQLAYARKTIEEQSPTPTISDLVSADLKAREAFGLKKYGVGLDRTDLDHKEWLQHAYEEALDFACYLKRMMEDMK